MARRRSRKQKAGKRKPPALKLRVPKLTPDADAARDEGPRLIPLPEANSPSARQGRDPGGLPTNRYVALADLALRLWNQPEPDRQDTEPEPPPPPRRSRP